MGLSPDFDPERERRGALFVWLPAGLAIFGLGGLVLVPGTWGFDDPGVSSGAAAGLGSVVVMAWFVSRRWSRRLSTAELRRAQSAATGHGRGPWLGATAGVAVAINAAGGVVGGIAFPTAFLCVVCTGCTVLAYVIVLFRRGLYQRRTPGRRSSR